MTVTATKPTLMMVQLWDRQFVVVPAELRSDATQLARTGRLDAAQLVRLAGSAGRLLGEASLGYLATQADPAPLDHSREPVDVQRLAHLCDPEEVREAGLGEMTRTFVSLAADGTPCAGAGYQAWSQRIAHLAVLANPAMRRGGHATRIAQVAIKDALCQGLVPQWRARMTNEASTQLGRRLNFLSVGTQATVVIGQ